MKTATTILIALLGLSIFSIAYGQERRSINARISGWVVRIDYSDLDKLPAGAKPVSRVHLSHPSNNLKATMEVPFESFFALWSHLQETSNAEVSQALIALPPQKDGAILQEGDSYFKAVTSDTAALLIRLWLDTFQHEWVEDSSALTKDQLKFRGNFGYLLRHNPFPSKGNFMAGFTEKFNAQQGAAGQPTTPPRARD